MQSDGGAAGIARDRSLIVTLSLALMASLLLLAGSRSPVLAGTETGTCTLVIAAEGLPTEADAAIAVPFEGVSIRGTGWVPNTQLALDTGGFVNLEGVPRIDVEPDGRVNSGIISARHYGTFALRVSQESPACVQEVSLQVLPIADMHGHWIHVQAVKWLYLSGITSGCGSDLFCPGGQVTRGQMATFLVRALGLPATGTDYFTDDDGSVHEANINRLRAAGITSGCGPGLFCPSGLVTRAQMATFLVRAFDLPATGIDYFTDDEGSVHEPNINRLRASGITAGCNGVGLFCPNSLVTRASMATFLFRALN